MILGLLMGILGAALVIKNLTKVIRIDKMKEGTYVQQLDYLKLKENKKEYILLNFKMWIKILIGFSFLYYAPNLLLGYSTISFSPNVLFILILVSIIVLLYFEIKEDYLRWKSTK